MKRSIEDWDERTQRIRTRAEERAEEGKKPGQGMDTDHTDVAREIGAVYMNQSDAKLNEEVFEFFNSA